MKKVVLFSLSILLTGLCVAQSGGMDCSIFKTGKFSYFDSLNHTVFVIRKKNKQHEYNYQTKVKTVLKIKWISGCAYELTQVWSDSKARRKSYGAKTVVVITKIIGNTRGYEYTCRCEDIQLQMKNAGIMRKED